jgi:excisionase family DNA binding protein
MTDDRWILVREARVLLSPDRPLTRQRVAQLIRDGHLRAKRLGSQWLVSRASIDRRVNAINARGKLPETAS